MIMSGRINTLTDCYSSGSEHEPESLDCLAEMVNGYMEDDLGKEDVATAAGETHLVTAADALYDRESRLLEELDRVLGEMSGDYTELEAKLLADVLSAKEQAEEENQSLLRQRHIMNSLQAMGYNAAVCKSKWSQNKGEYSYLDVLIEPSKRLIVDTEFRMQFEIARPSEHYLSILTRIPPVFVGRPAKLEKIVRVIADAMKQSLKKRELMLPPWRKPDYLRAKWFSAYRRTTNLSPAPKSSLKHDWKLPLSGPKTKKPAPPELTKLLTEAGLVRRSQLVAVVM